MRGDILVEFGLLSFSWLHLHYSDRRQGEMAARRKPGLLFCNICFNLAFNPPYVAWTSMEPLFGEGWGWSTPSYAMLGQCC